MKQGIDFGSEKIFRNILKTAFPMLVAQVLNLLYSIVDRIYIGRIPGEGTAALAGIGLAFPLIIIITAFTNLYGSGGAPLFSMERGRENERKAAEILNTSYRLEVLTGVVLMIAGQIFARPLLILFGADEPSLVYSIPYLRIYLLGTVFSMIATGMNPYVNAEGFPGFGMISVVIGAVANILLDPVFIFVFGMGVRGAALATILSQFLSMLFVLWFFRKKSVYLATLRPTKGEKYLPHAMNIISLGTASFIMQFTNSLVSIFCNNMLMKYGGALYVSVMTIISSVRQILDTPVHAITEGTSPILSYNYGAKKNSNVRRAIFIMTAFCFAYTLIVWILILASPESFVAIFSPDPSLQKDAAPALHLYFAAFIFQTFQFSGQSVFKSLGKRNKAIFFSLFRKVVMVVPLTLLLPRLFGLGVNGVFLAEPISNLIGGLACYITMLLTILPELKQMENGSK